MEIINEFLNYISEYNLEKAFNECPELVLKDFFYDSLWDIETKDFKGLGYTLYNLGIIKLKNNFDFSKKYKSGFKKGYGVVILPANKSDKIYHRYLEKSRPSLIIDISDIDGEGYIILGGDYFEYRE